jgi:hypothetical protein
MIVDGLRLKTIFIFENLAGQVVLIFRVTSAGAEANTNKGIQT